MKTTSRTLYNVKARGLRNNVNENTEYKRSDKNAEQPRRYQRHSVLYYGTEACPTNSSSKHSFQFTINRVLFKIFGVSRKLLIRNWCNLEGICRTVNARSDWKLATFDLDLWPWEPVSYLVTFCLDLWFWELFSYFLFTIHISSTFGSFECINLATSFSVWRYIFRISRLSSSFKVMGLISRSQQPKSGRAQVCAPLGHSLILYT